jgi:hypothetical protein
MTILRDLKSDVQSLNDNVSDLKDRIDGIEEHHFNWVHLAGYLCIVAGAATAIFAPAREWGWFLFVAFMIFVG